METLAHKRADAQQNGSVQQCQVYRHRRTIYIARASGV
jgi:hypothetical protein